MPKLRLRSSCKRGRLFPSFFDKKILQLFVRFRKDFSSDWEVPANGDFPPLFQQKNLQLFLRMRTKFLRLRSFCKRGRRFLGRRGQRAATRLVTLIGKEVSWLLSWSFTLPDAKIRKMTRFWATNTPAVLSILLQQRGRPGGDFSDDFWSGDWSFQIQISTWWLLCQVSIKLLFICHLVPGGVSSVESNVSSLWLWPLTCNSKEKTATGVKYQI